MNSSDNSKKKIGIITCFDMYTVNFGNRFQSYALNKYLREQYPDYIVETLWLGKFKKSFRTKKENIIRRILDKANEILTQRKMYPSLTNRLNNSITFVKENINITNEMSFEDLLTSDYDSMIVGSDVVWLQREKAYLPIRFLDFETHGKFKKISYAASFGRDYIPECNIPYVKKALLSFDGISVREKSSIKMLNELGIENVFHAVDSTLLLSKEDWINLECEPDDERITKEKYIFVYLLGDNKNDRENIMKTAKQMGCLVVDVPYANGFYNPVDKYFADIHIMDCSPGEWLWLVHNAKLIITDSFHGTVFSTIFHTPFFVLYREEYGINNRMLDFINGIEQGDKFIQNYDSDCLKKIDWNFEKTDGILQTRIADSKLFLDKYLSE